MNAMQLMLAIREATISARNRVGDERIGTQADKGLCRIVLNTPTSRGKFDVTPVSDWMPASEIMSALNTYKA